MSNAAPSPKQKSPKTAGKAPGHWISLEEMAALQDRLREAQETLDAIRNGEVDALVVSGDNGSQVYSLAGAEQPYRVYVEQMQEGAVTVSAEGVILYCNQRFADMAALPLERAISSSLTDRISPEAWQKISEVLRDGADRVKLDDALQTSEGSQIAVSFTASQLRLEDQNVVCLIVADLSTLREQENLRLAKEVADKANAAKDVFLAALSHELRTPLTPALMTVMDMQSDADLPDKFRESAALIRRCIELETRLIDDLLDITLIARGKLKLNSAPGDLHAALRGALQICQGDIDAKNLQVELHLEARHHHTVADMVRIQQAFWNIIRNAIKFTPSGGRIVIHSANDDDGNIRFEVADSGVGFDAKKPARLFTAFEQENESVGRKFGGLGLGLTISKKVVDAHGGSISGKSEGKDRGATFTICLPLQPLGEGGHHPAPHQSDVSAAEKARGLHLLLVEDHADTATTMRELLKRRGHQVTAADSGRAALEMAAATKFDIVISDLGLPDMSGSELMAQLRDHHGLKGIAVSGFGTEEDIAESRTSGFVHHLTKPISIERLDEILLEVS